MLVWVGVGVGVVFIIVVGCWLIFRIIMLLQKSFDYHLLGTAAAVCTYDYGSTKTMHRERDVLTCCSHVPGTDSRTLIPDCLKQTNTAIINNRMVYSRQSNFSEGGYRFFFRHY